MTHAYVVFDWETRSARSLKALGVHKYAECPHFDALCAGYVWPDGTEALWTRGELPPADLCTHVAAGGILVAHNAGFELAVWAEMHRRDTRWPELRPEQVHDTMAMCRAMGLPGGLGDAAMALRLNVRKDVEGHKVMMLLCQPKRPPRGYTGPPVFEEAPHLLRRLGEYCMIDVEVQHAIYRMLPKLSADEQAIFAMHECINERGVLLDVEAASAAADLVADEQMRLSGEIRAATGEAVKSGNARAQMLQWLEGQGVVIGDLKKTTIQKMLEDPAALADKATVKMVLKLRQDAAKASTAKLSAMGKNVCADGRARGLYTFYGANTGRSSGRRLQTHNLVRPPKHFKAEHAASTIETVRRRVKASIILRALYGSVMGPVSWSLRGFILAETGSRFICCDFSNIEGRVLAWLAGEEWKLDAFRAYDTFKLDMHGNPLLDAKGEPVRMGPDLYHVTAAGILGIPVTSVDEDQRQVMGKVPELALGFQGGLGAFTSLGANYGVHVVLKREDAPASAKYVVTEAQVEDIKTKWREKNSRIQALWYGLSDAAMEAVRKPGKVTGAGLLEFCKSGDFLQMRLPSGRCVTYAYPTVEVMTTTFYEREVAKWAKEIKEAAEEVHTDEGSKRYGFAVDVLRELLENPDKREQLAFWGINSKSKNKKFGKLRAYGGLLTENATQATARDFQFHAGLRVEAAGYPIVMHTHDELLTEVPRGFGSVDELAQIMCASPGWAGDIPVSAAGWEGDRYRK